MDHQATPLFADRLDALAARLDAQAARMADLEAENAGLKAQLARIAQPTVAPRAAASGADPKVGRRGMLTKALGATAAAALLTVATEAATAEASARGTIIGAAGAQYGLAGAPLNIDPVGVTTNFTNPFHFYGVVGAESLPGGITPPDGAGVLGQANGYYGVIGLSSDGKGMYGESVSNIGVHGRNASASQPAMRGDGQGVGVLGTATGSGTGLWGTTVSGIGLLGTSTSGIGLSGSTSGNNVGVFGSADGPGMIGGIGLVGRSANGTGVVGQGATAARFDGPVIINGTLTLAGGAKSAAVPHPDGIYRRMYCVEATESWFEDFGTATLTDGRAVVDLDPEFDAVVRGDNYRVFLTPIEMECSLYVSRKGPHRFVVQSVGAAVSGTFDYRLAARRKDIEGKRLEKVILKAGKLSENLKLPDLPIPARVPDLLPPSRGGGEKPR